MTQSHYDWRRRLVLTGNAFFFWSLSAELPFEYGLILLFEGELNDKIKMM